ncbi:MAG: hypothetical protein IID41_14640 [Planctomycetes bacterium]|nr:hypothetical protein [Planctomycetota bacterium]
MRIDISSAIDTPASTPNDAPSAETIAEALPPQDDRFAILFQYLDIVAMHRMHRHHKKPKSQGTPSGYWSDIEIVGHYPFFARLFAYHPHLQQDLILDGQNHLPVHFL